MSEAITVTVEAEDKLTPLLGRLDNFFTSLGMTINRTANLLGVQNAAVEGLTQSLFLLGSVIRTVTYIKEIMALASSLVASAQTAQTAATIANSAALAGYGATATTVTAINYGLAASFRAVFAAMGPIGWLLFGLSALGGAAAGFAIAGGFQRQQSMPIAVGSETIIREIEKRYQVERGPGTITRETEKPYQVERELVRQPVVIEQRFNINVDSISSEMDIEKMVRRTGELWAKEVKRYLG